MFVRNYVTGVVCFIFMIGMVLKPADCSEEKEPFISLIEKEKAYLATPKKTFQYYCSPCHGENANGKGIFFTIDLKPSPRDLTDVEYMAALTDDYLLNFISKGSAAMEKSELCPPWGNTLGEDSIKGLIAYLRGLTISKSKDGEEPAVKKEAAVTEAGSKGAPKAIIWSVLILSCSFLVFVAINEWKKLGIEEASERK